MGSTLGGRIKEIRKDSKLKQKEFSAKIKSSPSHISGIESNSVPISDRLIEIICMQFNVNEDWLRNGIGNKYNEEQLVDKANVKLELIEGIESLNTRILELTEYMRQGPDEEVTQISYCLSSVIDMLRNLELDGELRYDYFDALEDLFSDLGRYIQNLSYSTKISYEKNIDDKARDIDNIISKYAKSFNRAYEEIGEIYLRKYIEGYESLRSRNELSASYEADDHGTSVFAGTLMSSGEDVPESSLNYLLAHKPVNVSNYTQRTSRAHRNSQIIWFASGTGKTEGAAISVLKEFLKKRNESTHITQVAEEPTAYVPKLGKVAAGPPIDLIENNSGICPIFGVKDVDFALEVNGDSMEPEYPNGSNVFVKKQETLENGEVGIIMIDDQVVCKKFYRMNDHVELRSINKRYDPIILTGEDVRILGKVVN